MAETLWANDRYRLVLEHDDQTDNPRQDYDQLGILAVIERNPGMGDSDAPAKAAVAWLRDNPLHTPEAVRSEFGATIALPVTVVEDRGGYQLLVLDGEPDGYIFDSPEALAAFGTPADRVEACLRAELQEYNRWLRGETYVALLQEKIVWTPSNPSYPARTSWETVEAVGGFIGDEYAQEGALDHFPEGSYAA